MHNLIFLVGYRGVGKTTLGRYLAETLGYGFYDTDHHICKKAGKPIRSIVEDGGWDVFRRHEAESLVELAKGEKRVISTGGGAVLHTQIWAELCRIATVIWLYADKDTVLKRISGDSTTGEMRPPLMEGGIQNELDKVLKQREPLYQDVCHFRIDTGKMGVEDTVRIICEKLSSSMTQKEQ